MLSRSEPALGAGELHEDVLQGALVRMQLADRNASLHQVLIDLPLCVEVDYQAEGRVARAVTLSAPASSMRWLSWSPRGAVLVSVAALRSWSTVPSATIFPFLITPTRVHICSTSQEVTEIKTVRPPLPSLMMRPGRRPFPGIQAKWSVRRESRAQALSSSARSLIAASILSE